MTTIPGATTFPSEPPQKNFRFRARGHFWGSPLFLAILGLWHDRGATTLNFGPISTKLGGTVQAIKKMTNGLGPGQNYGETGVFMFGRKVVFGLKMGFTPKITQNDISSLDYLGKGNFVLWTTFSGRGQNMVNPQKWDLFFGPKISVFGPKIRFLPYDPNFGRSIFSPRHDG